MKWFETLQRWAAPHLPRRTTAAGTARPDSAAPGPDRSFLNFPAEARKAFSFLIDMGFRETEALSTLILFRKGDLEVDVYHGRRSYEIGAGITRDETRYSLGQFIDLADDLTVKRFRYPAYRTPEGVKTGLEVISTMMKRYAASGLRGDAQVFAELDIQRKKWGEEFALDVEESQTRPKAEEAWRNKDYAKAAELYAKFRPRLTPAEVQKLAFAEKRRGLPQK